jgi:hypothetical protein
MKRRTHALVWLTLACGWAVYMQWRPAPSAGRQERTVHQADTTSDSATDVAPSESDTPHAVDPDAATAALPSSGWTNSLAELKTLAAESPQEAIAALAAVADKHDQKSAATAVLPIVARGAPDLAVKAAWDLGLGRLADEPSEHRVLEHVAREWARTDFSAAMAWVDSLPSDEELRRDYVIKGVAAAAATRHAELAARLISARLAPDSPVHAEATLDAMRQWAKRDYAGALSWVSLFAPGPLRERALDELAAIDSRATSAGEYQVRGF